MENQKKVQEQKNDEIRKLRLYEYHFPNGAVMLGLPLTEGVEVEIVPIYPQDIPAYQNSEKVDKE